MKMYEHLCEQASYVACCAVLCCAAGAPPDMFDPNGQNWGFPTYNWEEMAKDDYHWWQRRCVCVCVCALFVRVCVPCLCV